MCHSCTCLLGAFNIYDACLCRASRIGRRPTYLRGSCPEIYLSGPPQVAPAVFRDICPLYLLMCVCTGSFF